MPQHTHLNKPLEVCILAGGKGSRMGSDRPKALQTLAGRPLLAHLLETAQQLSPRRIHLVTGEAGEAGNSIDNTTGDLGYPSDNGDLGYNPDKSAGDVGSAFDNAAGDAGNTPDNNPSEVGKFPDKRKSHAGFNTGSSKAQLIRSSITDLTSCPISWVYQEQSLGTGHAVQLVAKHLDQDCRLLVLLGDVPLVRLETLQALLRLDADISLLSVLMPDPTGYGRLVRVDADQHAVKTMENLGKAGIADDIHSTNEPTSEVIDKVQGDSCQVTHIVEERDATAEQRQIKEVNTGVMVLDSQHLDAWLAQLTCNNQQGEYLLTDIIEHASKSGHRVLARQAENPLEVTGINTMTQLSKLERAMQINNARQLMEAGVQLLDPSRFDLRGRVKTGRNVRIDINVILEGEVELGDNVVLGPNVIIRDSVIKAGTEVRANSLIEESTLGANCIIGPFARLRPGTELADEVRIGNFVEIKKSKVGKGSKANHLAYLGDSTLGEEVNVGAGAITCNYDGVSKHETHIADGAFIGSNVALVAPVSIGAGATIGAGSTITRDVEGQSLAVARGKQRVISNWRQAARSPKTPAKQKEATS